MIEVNHIYNEPNSETTARMPDGFVDCIVTDPPYGYSFMNKDWDKAVPSVEIWKECLRVLKPGAFAFIMCAPRQDVLSQMIVNLTQAGFRTDFTSLYHCFASGFPKAGNVSKLVDKKLGAGREVVGFKPIAYPDSNCWGEPNKNSSNKGAFSGEIYGDGESEKGYGKGTPITEPVTDEAKKLAGSFTGFNPKPALEVVLVVMRPLECKTFTEQAMKNGKGCTHLDACRIPYKKGEEVTPFQFKDRSTNVYGEQKRKDLPEEREINDKGRFPANILVSDDALNDGNVYESSARPNLKDKEYESTLDGHIYSEYKGTRNYNNVPDDSGSFFRYFSLDAWWAERLKNFPKSVLQTFPFLIEPKASKSEKNFGITGMEEKPVQFETQTRTNKETADKFGCERKSKAKNTHPTVKPVKLCSYLITLGSREHDIVYDPFGGSGTTGVAAEMLNRKWILSEMDKDSCMIAEKRLYPFKIVQKLF